MKRKCANVNECGDIMIRGYYERWEQSQMIVSKCYQNILTYESVKLMKRPSSKNTLMKVLRIIHLILMMKNHLLSYDVLILAANFDDVWVECNGT